MRRRLRGDSGMTLVEMSLAMAMFAFIAAALTAALGAGLRTIVVARQNLVARTTAEDALERMRALPFYENRATAPTDVDTLDLWFPNLQAGANGTGYDSSDMSYTTVIPVDRLTNGMMTIVATFVVDTSGQPIAPSSGYDHEDPSSDTPPSRLLDVTVAVTWEMLGHESSYELSSTVGSKTFPGTEGRAAATAAALSASTAVPAPHGNDVWSVTVDGPEASVSTFLGDMSRASASATGARATSTVDSGVTCATTGTEMTATAPPEEGGTELSMTEAKAHSIPCSDGSVVVAEIPSTSITGLSAGFPAPANLPGADAEVTMFPASPESERDFGLYANVLPDSRQILAEDDGEKVAQVRVESPDASPGVSVASGSDEGSGASFDSSVSATDIGTIDVLPTAFAPDGVVRVDVDQVALSCTAVSGTGASGAGGSFSGQIRYWDAGTAFTASGQPDTADDGYKTVSISSSLPSDPLASLDPASIVVQRQYGTDSTGKSVVASELKLSDYLVSWRALTEVRVATTSDGTVSAGVDGVVSLVTRGTASMSDPASQISLDVGKLSCSARDLR